jgi:phosphatidylglycerol:prolipoprotein diacylglycerol transferase
MDRALLNEIYQALDPIAFWIGPFAVRWYGLGYIVGILLGGYVISRTCKRWNINFSFDALLTVFIAATLGIILGGRLGYVLFYDFGRYLANPAEILAFSQGGMSFHGGVLGMALAAYVASRFIKMPLATLADLIVIAAPIGIFLVRITNFINGELWGAPTDLPWGVEFESGGGIARHPTQLYEALLEGVVIFIALQVLSRKKPLLPRGSYLGIFLLLYGIFRIAVEFVRQPDIQLGYLAGGWLTMGMVLSIPLVIIGLALFLIATRRRSPQKGSRA